MTIKKNAKVEGSQFHRCLESSLCHSLRGRRHGQLQPGEAADPGVPLLRAPG